MSEVPLDLVEHFAEKIDELGIKRAISWLEERFEPDSGVLQAAQLWINNIDQQWAKDAFVGAIDASTGTESTGQTATGAENNLAALLEALLAGQAFPASLSKATLRDYLRDLRRSMERVAALGIKADATDGQAPRL